MRCFVALPVPEPVRRWAAEVIAALKAGGPDVKWVEPGNLHLTLKFLGEASEDRVPDLVRALETACAGRAPLNLEITAPGAFPNARRPRVVWLGLAGDLTPLAELAAAVERALEPLGFPSEDRPFRAHLTLGRVRRPRKGGRQPDTRSLARDLAGSDFAAGPEFRAERVVLMQSTLTPGGAIYQPRHEVVLAAG
jgi:RNA 2',3'-cyclic 3'-phosphodiesterase